MKKNIVTIGGGNGTACTVRALKTYADQLDLTAIVAMSDSGGSSGKLREEFGILPPGDILRACLAMAPYDYHTLKKIFNKNRFTQGKLADHSLGNMFVALATEYTGDFMQVVEGLLETVDAIGKVYPVTLASSDLCAQMSGGEMIMGETHIDRPKKKSGEKIDRVWLQPTPLIFEEARTAILEADYIILGPGSLYTSIIAPLLVEGVQDAIRESSAQLMYIPGNAYETDGEQGPTTLSGFIDALERHLPRPLDLIFYNSHVLTDAEKVYYAERRWSLITEIISQDRIVAIDYEKEGGGLSVETLGALLMNYLV